MNENMVACPVSPAQPGTQGNNQVVGPQALAPRLAALLPACTGAAEFGARHRSSHSERAEDWAAVRPRCARWQGRPRAHRL